MPPKAKKADGASKKTEQKQKVKQIEDKTFGLKNKKGNKQQKFVKMVETQVKQGGKSARQVQLEEQDKYAKRKEDKKKAAEELNNLFKPVDQKVGKGVDPKSVLCAFYKQGQCQKGDRCKFSHDLNIGRKGEKRSVYDDARAKEEETMDDWDEAKLEDVVNQKHGDSNKKKMTTEIICKFFLEALENSKYGWFWACPNGDGCHYKHALPPGFVLKKDKKKEEKTDQISLEELVEKERAALNSQNLTKVTLESFLKWKDRKKREKVAKITAIKEKKKSDYTAGKAFGVSGREMFEFNPDMAVGADDEGADDTAMYREGDDDEAQEAEEGVVEIDLESLAQQAREVDGTGTMSKGSDRQGDTSSLPTMTAPNGASAALQNGVTEDGEDKKLDMAGALPPDPNKETDAAIAAAMAAVANGNDLADVPIDENLFDGDDIDLVDDELDNLELDD